MKAQKAQRRFVPLAKRYTHMFPEERAVGRNMMLLSTPFSFSQGLALLALGLALVWLNAQGIQGH